MLTYPCGAFYIGKTKHEFRRRMQEHINAAKIVNNYSPIRKHVPRLHQYKVPNFKLMALAWVHPDPGEEIGIKPS